MKEMDVLVTQTSWRAVGASVWMLYITPEISQDSSTWPSIILELVVAEPVVDIVLLRYIGKSQ